ncbi:FecR domain-containing protein [Niabella hirudinis]|uniref:FecR domain-containing protein n=1 Tax=Niabella hirudinis TaxID=1285929 RepID=UPI003EB75CE9
MEISPEILQRFFEGGCSKEQEAEVRVWLSAHPDVLARYMTEQSWEAFRYHNGLPAAISARILRRITLKMQARTRYWKWTAVAAALAVLIGLSYFLIQPEAPDAVPEPVAMACTRIENTSFVVKNIRLPDGSQVALAPGSIISFDSVFGRRRDIALKGNASFSVAKDRSKPFCVHTRNINITALGTVFSVEDKDTLLTSVRLLEGKVVVGKEPHVVKKVEVVFLVPGQELLFNNSDFSNKVQRFGNGPALQKADAEPPTGPITTVLVFDNEPMANVFKTIEQQYHLKVDFKGPEVRNMRFTGMYRPSSETIEQFLNTLALLNHLSIEKTKTGFRIGLDE